MTNENPRGLPVAWVDAADLSERECFEVLACSDKYKGVTQHELRYNTPLVLATDYAALLAERDELRGLLREVLERDGGNACHCINHSRKAEREYETGNCPHQRAISAMEGRDDG